MDTCFSVMRTPWVTGEAGDGCREVVRCDASRSMGRMTHYRPDVTLCAAEGGAGGRSVRSTHTHTHMHTLSKAEPVNSWVRSQPVKPHCRNIRQDRIKHGGAESHPHTGGQCEQSGWEEARPPSAGQTWDRLEFLVTILHNDQEQT